MYISVDKYQGAYEKQSTGEKLKTIVGGLSLPRYICSNLNGSLEEGQVMMFWFNK